MLRILHLQTEQEAEKELRRIGADPAGIARMLPKLDFKPILITGLKAAAANIIKQEMLSLGGDAAVARGTVDCSIKTTDLLLIANRHQLTRLNLKLQAQPFGLSSLSKKLQNFLDAQNRTAAYWQTSRRRLPLDKPLIMGILNLTPDSFSDGGRFNTLDKAMDHALQMEDEGADIIDIGAESTRPGAIPVSADQEIERLLPVIERLSARLQIPISVDTWKASVADAATTAGAEIINDISGLTFDPAMAAVVALHKTGVVLMHTRGTPQNMQQHTAYDDLMGELASNLFLAAQTAINAGISPAQIVLDPGIGFAKDLHGNLEILRRLKELTSLGYPLMVGCSRKAFIGTILEQKDPDQRLFGTAAAVAMAVASGAKVLRVHDVAAMSEVTRMTSAICNRRNRKNILCS